VLRAEPASFDIPMQVGRLGKPIPVVTCIPLLSPQADVGAFGQPRCLLSDNRQTGKEMQLVFHKPVRCVDWCSGVSHIRSPILTV